MTLSRPLHFSEAGFPLCKAGVLIVAPWGAVARVFLFSRREGHRQGREGLWLRGERWYTCCFNTDGVPPYVVGGAPGWRRSAPRCGSLCRGSEAVGETGYNHCSGPYATGYLLQMGRTVLRRER